MAPLPRELSPSNSSMYDIELLQKQIIPFKQRGMILANTKHQQQQSNERCEPKRSCVHAKWHHDNQKWLRHGRILPYLIQTEPGNCFSPFQGVYLVVMVLLVSMWALDEGKRALVAETPTICHQAAPGWKTEKIVRAQKHVRTLIPPNLQTPTPCLSTHTFTLLLPLKTFTDWSGKSLNFYR